MFQDLDAAFALATPLLLLVLAVLVFAARPAGRLNRVAGAYLLTTGAADLMWYFMWFGPSTLAPVFTNTGFWFHHFAIFSSILLLAALYGRRNDPWTLLGVVAGFVTTAAILLIFAAAPALMTTPVFGRSWGPLQSLSVLQAYVIAGVAVVASATAAASSRRTLIERRQASCVGIAFVILAANTGAGSLLGVARIAIGRLEPAFDLVAVAVAGGLLLTACAWSLPRLLAEVGPRARLAVGLVLVVSVGSALAALVYGFLDAPRPGWWNVWRRGLAMISASLLAIAFVRFGLAGFGWAARRRIEILGRASFVVLVLLLPALAVATVLHGSPRAVAAALLLGALATTLAPSPLRSLASAATRLLTLDPAGDAALAERARTYREALARRRAPSGGVPPVDDGALAALREELDLVDDDHARLADGVAGAAARGADGDALLLGRYRVLGDLGRGAFATASLAIDEATGRRVVLKRDHRPGEDERILREARALAAVDHPRVIPLLAVERVGHEVFLVLAHAPGGSLDRVLKEQGRLDARRADQAARDLLDALAALHSKGIVHRDVKPANLLLDENGRILLGDLAASHLAPPAETLTEKTLTSSPVIGSYATVAPEVLRGNRCGPPGDVYGAAATIFKLFTGEDYVDFRGASPVELMHAVLHAPARIPHPLLPAAVADVLSRALEKDPVARYPNARAMKAAWDTATATDSNPDGAA